MITVAIDARLRPGQVDGVARLASGLAAAMRAIPADRLRIVWITGADASWVEAELRDGDTIIRDPAIPVGSHDLWQRAGDDSEAVLHLLRSAPDPSGDPRLPRSPAELDGADIDLIHFLSQDAFVTELPSIYHPHDLQHAEFPQFLKVADIGWRELAWRTYAARAAVVCVGAPHTRDAVARHWPEVADAIRIVPLRGIALIFAPGSRLDDTEVPIPSAHLNAPLVLYPAALWPHKNHVRLIEAFVRAVGSDASARLVLTGFEPDPADGVSVAVRLLGADDRVLCPGRVSDAALTRLYAQATIVALPSVYEAGSFPLWEANGARVPVAASDIPGHRVGEECVGAWFDPFDVDDMGRAIARLLSEPRMAVAWPPPDASSEQVAEAFVDLYERVAGRSRALGVRGR